MGYGEKVSKYGVFSGPYFPVFSLNSGKYGPGKTPYLDSVTILDDENWYCKIWWRDWFYSTRSPLTLGILERIS